MKTLIILLIFTSALCGCALTYVRPTMVAPTISADVSISKANLLRATEQVLATDGYQITNSDDSAGVISTAQTNLHITPEQADCGTTMGLNYLKDNRTDTSVAFSVIVSEGKITVKATIEGDYKPQDTPLTCVSKGVLERKMLAQIIAKASV
ncbi:MAG TPA: hypothetical protein VNF46_05100 [Gammaproteobacteria bacterium]|nr:hypothetical protein [Gammaproteobacteria bacterium]